MNKMDKKSLLQMAYASSIGIAMVITIFGGLYVGIWLDRKLGPGFGFTFFFLAIGIAAGFRNLYTIIKKNFSDESPVIKCIKSEPHCKRPPPPKT
jgi:ATP synthase protein I